MAFGRFAVLELNVDAIVKASVAPEPVPTPIAPLRLPPFKTRVLLPPLKVMEFASEPPATVPPPKAM